MNDLLFTTAEIAIALAGFSGVVVAFRGGVGGLPTFRLSLLLSLSAEVVLFSFVPILSALKLSGATAWIVPGVLYGLVHLAHIAYSVFGYQAEKVDVKTPPLDKVLMLIGAVFSVSLVGACMFGTLSDIQILYGGLLIFVLCVAGTQFFRLLMLLEDD
ncbi:MAG: hypothetical protein ACI9ON_003004 [Limisphaerales bacterium]|jgi:hypothetical protein